MSAADDGACEALADVAKALHDAAVDLLTECAHFDRYRGRADDYCGYCETAAALLRARATDHDAARLGDAPTVAVSEQSAAATGADQ